jgi:hypothetical protein
MRITAAAYMLLILAPTVCVADGFFRCGSSLVSSDISVVGLLKKCGEPTSKRVSTEDDLDYGTKVGTWTTEKWRYDRGSRAAAMIVTIVNGKIRSIELAK